MSWFDTTGFANLAKSALKEAQKTFDKALDLEDIDEKSAASGSKEKGGCEACRLSATSAFWILQLILDCSLLVYILK